MNNDRKFGDLSYGIYIWHMIVVNFFIYYNIPEYLDGKVTDSLVIVFILLVSFLLALLSWNLVEKRALKYKQHSSRNTT